MKKIIFLGFLFILISINGQIAIGKDYVSSNSVSLEFYDGHDNRKGMILPWISSVLDLNSAVDGTMVFDTSDLKVKYKKAGYWFDLSIANNGKVNTILQDNLTDNLDAKVQIGGDPSTDKTEGVLVLADTSKAMVLPKVKQPHLNIINPEAGTIAYDPDQQLLAVFNGSVWTFWSAN